MSKYRHDLPQLSDTFFITDGGIETTLLFHDGLELPHFASFDLLKDDTGTALLRRYFETYVRIAVENQVGFVLESATWRASPDWAKRLGYSGSELDALNRRAIAMLSDIRTRHETPMTPMVISGNIGPRGDGYDPGDLMNPGEAENYHATQVATFAQTDVDMITAATLTNTPEAIGIVRAARKAGLPVVIGFTTETDGCLPTGQSLKDAIAEVDAATNSAPAYFMINCAHTTHFQDALDAREDWVNRVRGIRSNASRMSHAELDEAEELDDGDPEEFGAHHRDIRNRLGHINIIGGCCGTDHRHVEQACLACAA